MADVVSLTPAGDEACAATSTEDRVAAVRDALVSRDEAERLAELFRLLGEPTRARILYALVEAGELCVGDLAGLVEVAETTVSQALRLLRTAGVVRSRRDGRHVHYRLDDAHVRLLLDLSREHLRHGTVTGDG